MRRTRESGEVGIVIADLTGFAALTDAGGASAAAAVAARFFRVARRVAIGRGRIVKTMGDAVLVVTPDAAVAMAVALDLRTAVTEDGGLPPVHSGVAAGPVVWRDRDVFGPAVNIAARLADQAGPGEIRSDRPGATPPARPTRWGRRRSRRRRGGRGAGRGWRRPACGLARR